MALSIKLEEEKHLLYPPLVKKNQISAQKETFESSHNQWNDVPQVTSSEIEEKEALVKEIIIKLHKCMIHSKTFCQSRN